MQIKDERRLFKYGSRSKIGRVLKYRSSFANIEKVRSKQNQVTYYIGNNPLTERKQRIDNICV